MIHIPIGRLATTVLALTIALPARSASINSNTENFDFTGSSTSLSFSQFDSSLGTLTKVEFLIVPGSTLTLSGLPTDFRTFSCTGTGRTSLTILSDSIGLYVLSLDASARNSECTLGDTAATGISGTTLISDFRIPQFLGTGTTSLVFSKSSSASDITNPITRAQGAAQLRYTYDPVQTAPVPEPATWGLIAVALACAAWRNRPSHPPQPPSIASLGR